VAVGVAAPRLTTDPAAARTRATVVWAAWVPFAVDAAVDCVPALAALLDATPIIPQIVSVWPSDPMAEFANRT